MKFYSKNIKHLVGAFLVSLSFWGCEDVLDTKTTYEMYDKDVWRIPELAEGVLMQAYAAIPARPDNFGDNFLDCATDNAVTRKYGSDVYGVSMGGMTASSNPLGNWDLAYKQLQNVNVFLENGLVESILYNRADSAANVVIKRRLKGEALFLRAWWHFELLRVFGGKSVNGQALGIPLANKFFTQTETADFDKFKRATYRECVDFIINDLDSAIAYLPRDYNENPNDINLGKIHIGRADDKAAEVLKCRVYLYGASPAYQDDAVISINAMGDYTIVDPGIYENVCAQAALELDTVLRGDGFGAFYALKPTDIADAGTVTPSEIVFRKYSNAKVVEKAHFPPYYFGNAQTTPSHNLVKAYPTKSGYPQGHPDATDWTADAPYSNLDKRFANSIIYHGQTFGNSGEAIDVTPHGKDSPQYDIKGTRSGYYLAKFMSTNASLLTPTLGANSKHYNPLLRKAEVFLSFAELSNEAWGPTGIGPGCLYSAYDIIRQVRQKSGGITDVTYLDMMAESKSDFRKLIQNERRLEFAFEKHRYFDMRRCLLPLNEDILGVEVTLDEDDLPVIEEKVLEPRAYEVRHYYSPLPYGELVKNKNLVNNLGW